MATLAQSSLPAPRQIRFVNNQGQPPSKRRRINAACLTCRKRKTRCAGERPACSTCEKNGHKCLGYPDIVEKKDSVSSEDGGSTVQNTPGPCFSGQEKERAVVLTADKEWASHAEDKARMEAKVGFGADCDIGDGSFGEKEQNRGRKCPIDRLTEPSYPRIALPTLPARLDSFSRAKGIVARPETGTPSANSSANREQTTESQKWHQRPSSRHDEQKRRIGRQQSAPFNGGSDPGNLSPAHAQRHKHHTESHRVPYFRYFGPTAIVPGYKQMVVDVSVRNRHRSRDESSSTSSPGSSLTSGRHRHSHCRSDMTFEGADNLPFYDPNDSEPVHPLIMALLGTFFAHLGCSFPFLKESRILSTVSRKRAQPILVDAMCALAARFSDPPPTITNENGEAMSRSEYGNSFSQRAKAATVDTFPCPTIGAVQAFILMAYEGFGADQDSTLWMYLGIAIRMAVDLGLQKIVGIQYQAGTDPLYTRESGLGNDNDNEEGHDSADEENSDQRPATREDTRSQHDGPLRLDELRAIEQERIDTFWTVFFADRVISSGTGRPVTFRDDDVELALPEPAIDPATNWPAPFPTLVQIIHIYGRVSDVLNNIRNAEDLTQEKLCKLAQMEEDLTQLYQKQDPRLNFNAANFQQYVRVGQGPNFILVHFWFHALIIILHQPTLLAPFGGFPQDHKLSANSHVLSMSSAKTIADILAFAELIDPKSFIGNPFTSQPMYIAACAFLMELAGNASLPVSWDKLSPPATDQPSRERKRELSTGQEIGDAEFAKFSKHALLASNANQNYQRCYGSLQQIHTYWGGVRYILTALDQKAKGIWDCETYTSEEYESTKLRQHRSSFRQPDALENIDPPSAPQIAWSLTGTSNSSNPSLTLLFQSHGTMNGLAHNSQTRREHLQQIQSEHDEQRLQQSPQPISATPSPTNMRYDDTRHVLPEVPTLYTTAFPQANESAVRGSALPTPRQDQQRHKQPRMRPSTPCNSVKYASWPEIDVYNNGGSHIQARHHGRQQDYENSHLRSSYSDVQGSMLAQPHPQPLTYPSGTASARVFSNTTPPPHSVSLYGPATLGGASPASSSLADSRQDANDNSSLYMGHFAKESEVYRPDVVDDDMVGSSFSGMTCDPNANAIAFDSREIDIGSVNLPGEIPPHWLAYLPGNIVDLFDGNIQELTE